MNIRDLQPELKRYITIEKGLKAKTYRAIISTLNMLAVYSCSESVKSYNNGLIREFLCAGVQDRGWEPKTFRNHWQNLKAFFDWCIKKKIIKKNPVEGIEKPKMKKRLPRCLSKEDTKKVLYHLFWHQWPYRLEKQRNEAIITTFLFTGLRLQELLNLEVTEVNIEEGNILVKQGKGGKDRIVPIHPQLIPKLRAYFTERKKLLKPSRWFFTGIRSDKKLYPRDIRHICQAISKDADVKFTPHMLRHTFGKLMVEADFSIYKLKEIMGHGQVTTTQGYVSIASESIKNSFDKVRLL